ncbi:MAG: GNAT family N-acetyltransferase [Pseudomonadota bacterium]
MPHPTLNLEHSDPPLRVTFSRVGDPATVIVDWRALWAALSEAPKNAGPAQSFFLSPLWIETWLTHHGQRTGNDLWCARIFDADHIRAMGLFCVHKERRRGLLTVRQLVLHATGDADMDRITIEYNDLLCAPQMRVACWQALLAHLHTAHDLRWDEIILPGVTSPVAAAVTPAKTSNSLAHHVAAEARSYHVDLNGLRGAGIPDAPGFLSILSRNTRTQIRRAMRLYEEAGTLSLERADTVEKAKNWFDALSHWHTDKWAVMQASSGLSSTNQQAFHQSLIEKGIASGHIDLLRICVGESPIGYLYNFVESGTASFYAGGFKREVDNRLKPGLACQVLTTAHYLQGGFSVYDFMGGDDRYKKSLGTPGQTIVTVHLQGAHLGLTLERWARRVKGRLREKRRP